jgi:hypothetical protein
MSLKMGGHTIVSKKAVSRIILVVRSAFAEWTCADYLMPNDEVRDTGRIRRRVLIGVQ